MLLLEAMACGKPVITSARGPSQAFCSEQTAYLVSAREEIVPDEPPPLGKLTGPFTWFEPAPAELVRTLRHVYDHRKEAAQRGLLAAKHIRQHFPRPRITQMHNGSHLLPYEAIDTRNAVAHLATSAEK